MLHRWVKTITATAVLLFAVTEQAVYAQSTPSLVEIAGHTNSWMRYSVVHSFRPYIQPVLALSTNYLWCLRYEAKPASHRPKDLRIWLEDDRTQIDLAMLEDDCVVLPDEPEKYKDFGIEVNSQSKRRGDGNDHPEACNNDMPCQGFVSEIRIQYPRQPADYASLWGGISAFPEEHGVGDTLSRMLNRKKPFRFLKLLKLKVSPGSVLRITAQDGMSQEFKEQDGWIKVLPNKKLLDINSPINLDGNLRYAVVTVSKAPVAIAE
ncbi:hypothetical protein [Undibacterium curvum]|uniref:Uncharacterized protein n=1 Tax=Undibacterium curvum TaxID=2762294 RepID=A0ABR7A921_9BURK|nr:hypothetical protein [Undibacterium curvum]MBC3933395.1 hypothetical protein [Undibacterium curvum]